MIRIEFTEEAIDKLRYERFHHPHPRVQRKMEALLLQTYRPPQFAAESDDQALIRNRFRGFSLGIAGISGLGPVLL